MTLTRHLRAGVDHAVIAATQALAGPTIIQAVAEHPLTDAQHVPHRGHGGD